MAIYDDKSFRCRLSVEKDSRYRKPKQKGLNKT